MLARLNTIDIDESVVKIGTDYFGFKTELGANFRSEIIGAEEYLKNEALPGKTNALFIDIASSDSKTAFIPPKFTLTQEFFDGIHKILSEESHVVLFNTCCYSEADRHEVHKFMTSQFKHVSYIKCTESSNRVYIMSNTHAPHLSKTNDNTIKYFVKTFCDGQNADGYNWATEMNMSGMLSEIKSNQGNKAEVKIEHLESKNSVKKKKPKKK